MKSKCAKFYFIYKYLSTSEHMFKIARYLAYWSLRYDDIRMYKFLIQGLGSLYFENTKQGNPHAQNMPYTHSRAFATYTYKFKPIAIFLISELVQTSCHWSQFLLLIAVGHTRTRPSLQGPLCGCIKLFIPLKQKGKRNIWTAFMLVQ